MTCPLGKNKLRNNVFLNKNKNNNNNNNNKNKK